jgi:hypothetical protein
MLVDAKNKLKKCARYAKLFTGIQELVISFYILVLDFLYLLFA